MKNKKTKNKKIVIIGSGAFGTAVANYLSDINNEVCIYGIDKTEIDDINNFHINKKYFPNVKLNKNIWATLDMSAAVENSFMILFAIPSKSLEIVIKEIIDNLQHPVYFVNLSKGFNFEEKKFMYQVIEEKIPKNLNLGVLKLSGGSFANELITKKDTGFILACEEIDTANKLIEYFLIDYVFIETSNQIRGIEILSILKNAYAVLMGIIDSLGYKENTKSLFFTKIIQEIILILDIFSINKEIFFSYAGIGDLFLTLSYKTSRNFQIGEKIGKENYRLPRIEKEFKTIEGIWTIQYLYKNVKNNKYKLNLIELLYNNLYSKDKTEKLFLNYLKNQEH